jgi:hypothetical protein
MSSPWGWTTRPREADLTFFVATVRPDGRPHSAGSALYGWMGRGPPGHRWATLERLAAVYRTGGWPASVEGDGLTAPYSAPSAGPAPWHLYRLRLHTAVGVATGGAVTR